VEYFQNSGKFTRVGWANSSVLIQFYQMIRVDFGFFLYGLSISQLREETTRILNLFFVRSACFKRQYPGNYRLQRLYGRDGFKYRKINDLSFEYFPVICLLLLWEHFTYSLLRIKG
jgi:hypothetical protein